MSNKVMVNNIKKLPGSSMNDTTYTLIGSVFEHPVILLLIQNKTTVLLSISTDGTNEKMVLSPNENFSFDITSNKNQYQESLVYPARSGIYVKYETGSAPGAAENIYVTSVSVR